MTFFKKLPTRIVLFSFLIPCSPIYAMLSTNHLIIAAAIAGTVHHLTFDTSNHNSQENNVPLWIPASHTCEHTNNHIICHWSIPRLENTQTTMVPFTCKLPDCLHIPEIVNIIYDDQNNDQYNASAWRHAPLYRLNPYVQQALQKQLLTHNHKEIHPLAQLFIELFLDFYL